jgi:hypothetical protein
LSEADAAERRTRTCLAGKGVTTGPNVNPNLADGVTVAL